MKYEIYLFGNRIRGFDWLSRLDSGEGNPLEQQIADGLAAAFDFCMGVSIGRNGGGGQKPAAFWVGKAVLFAVMTAIGSIAVVYILSTLFLEKEGKK